MKEITTVGLDLAKHLFQVHAVDASGTVALRRRSGGRSFCCSSRACPPA